MASWGYSDSNGPATWAKNFSAANGSNQSPVDIATGACVHDANLANLVIEGPKDSGFVVENTGVGFKANTKKSTISGGPLGGKYTLIQFHVHWGNADDQGAEHTVDGKKFAAESVYTRFTDLSKVIFTSVFGVGEYHFSQLHSVYWNSDKYSSFADALGKPDGVCIAAALIEAGAEHAGFKVISDCVPNMQTAGQNVTVSQEFDPNCLFPAETNKYWTYQGSLTNPPCTENITWIMFKNTVTVSADQLKTLRTLLPANHRELFPIGSRKITASF